jgi:hypothetical protein
MRAVITAVAALFLAGCAAVQPHRDSADDLWTFEPHAADERVRYEPGAERYAERVARLLPVAIAQVEAGHYRPFAAPVVVHICGSDACFARNVSGAPRFTAAVIYENRLLLAPRLFEREPERLHPILVHELSHLHLGQSLGHYTMGIPVWFHEGLASLVASGGGADLVSEEDARRAIAAGEHFLPDGAHDNTGRKNAGQWGLKTTMFYRQSMMFLAHLKAFGEDRFRRMLLELQNRARFDEAFVATFGGGALELAQEFFSGLRCARPQCTAAAGAP